jgi:hypothetical protein
MVVDPVAAALIVIIRAAATHHEGADMRDLRQSHPAQPPSDIRRSLRASLARSRFDALCIMN